MSTANRHRKKVVFAKTCHHFHKTFRRSEIVAVVRHRKTFSDQLKCHVYSQREEGTLAALFRMLNLAKMCSLECKSLHRSVAGKIKVPRKVHENASRQTSPTWIAMVACLHLTLSDTFGFIRAHPQTKVDSTARGAFSRLRELFDAFFPRSNFSSELSSLNNSS